MITGYHELSPLVLCLTLPYLGYLGSAPFLILPTVRQGGVLPWEYVQD